jgi:hypothetical protein
MLVTPEPSLASRARPKSLAEIISLRILKKSIESPKPEEQSPLEESMVGLTSQELWVTDSTKRTIVCRLKSK